MTTKFTDLKTALSVVKDGDVVVTSGFVGCANPEALEKALEDRFLESQSPKNLTLMYVAGQGDGKDKSVNHFAHKTLLDKVVAGHFNKAPKLMEMMANNEVKGYNVPQGALAQMLRNVAGKKPGVITHVGLNTFADPRVEGSKVNEITTEDIVELMEIDGKEYLFYKAMKFDVALIKGSYADERGNISMELDAVPTEVLSIAQAVHNCQGKVIVQVNKIVKEGSLDPKLVKIPGIYVDYIVEVKDPSLKEQAYGIDYEAELAGNIRVSLEEDDDEAFPLDAKKVIARRAAMELRQGYVANLGIGVPELVARVAKEEGIGDYATLTVESGPVGGIPQSGSRFGSSVNADAILDQAYQFDFYEGGGLDICFLGLAQADSFGNLNVSKFGTRIAGCGGFISISQNSKKVVFCGTFTAKGLRVEISDGALKIAEEGKMTKFKKDVEQITFSGDYARSVGQPVLYITERCVFELNENGFTLIEIAPGVDMQKDILNQMEFTPLISDNLKFMDSRIFVDAPMGLK